MCVSRVYLVVVLIVSVGVTAGDFGSGMHRCRRAVALLCVVWLYLQTIHHTEAKVQSFMMNIGAGEEFCLYHDTDEADYDTEMLLDYQASVSIEYHPTSHP